MAWLKAEISIAPDREITEYDALFVRVAIRNVGKVPILVPAVEDPFVGDLHLLLSGMGDATQSFPPGAGGGLAVPPPRVALAPGQCWIVYYVGDMREMLRVPPCRSPGARHSGRRAARAKEHAEERRKQFTDEGRMPPRWIGSDVRRLQELFDEPRRFWKELGSQIRVKAKLSLDRTIWLTREEKEAEERKTLAETGNYPPWRVHLYAEAPPIRIKPRRPEELALLTKPWPGTPPGKEGPPSMWPWRDQRRLFPRMAVARLQFRPGTAGVGARSRHRDAPRHGPPLPADAHDLL